MIRIINKKRYNTETATKVSSDSFSYPHDFNYCYEALYLTKNKNWFIHYKGGANSKYAVYAGNNSRTGGSGIKPLTEQEAYQWLEKTGDDVQLEEYFSDKLTDA